MKWEWTVELSATAGVPGNGKRAAANKHCRRVEGFIMLHSLVPAITQKMHINHC